MKRNLRASFTVEASFIMAISLWAIVSCIQFAYRIHDQVMGAVVLQELIEIARHDETGASLAELAAEGRRLAGAPFSMPDYEFELDETLLTVQGKARGDGVWGMEIQMRKFNPEEFLRMTTLFQTREEKEAQAEEKETVGAE